MSQACNTVYAKATHGIPPTNIKYTRPAAMSGVRIPVKGTLRLDTCAILRPQSQNHQQGVDRFTRRDWLVGLGFGLGFVDPFVRGTEAAIVLDPAPEGPLLTKYYEDCQQVC